MLFQRLSDRAAKMMVTKINHRQQQSITVYTSPTMFLQCCRLAASVLLVAVLDQLCLYVCIAYTHRVTLMNKFVCELT